MKICEGFEVVNVAEEYIAVPVGEKVQSFCGMVVLNEASAFLLEKMQNSVTVEELVDILMERYDVGYDIAYEDIKNMLSELIEIGLISE